VFAGDGRVEEHSPPSFSLAFLPNAWCGVFEGNDRDKETLQNKRIGSKNIVGTLIPAHVFVLHPE